MNTKRRDFLKQATLGGTAASMGFAAPGHITDSAHAAQALPFNRIFYRDLGSTGFKVTEIGFGLLHIGDTALINAAIDAGINYFDTAHSYMNGVCEETLGKVMKTRRNEIVLTTKVSTSQPSRMRDMINTSLKRLQTDHVDLFMLHGAGGRNQVFNEDIMKVFDDARREGKTRFIGLSTHNQVEVLNAVVESKFWQAVLFPYNYFSPPDVAVAVEKARKAGIAIIAMKALITVERPRKPYPDIRTDKTGSTTNQQALLKWVLQNPWVDTVIPGISSFEHLQDDIAVMGMRLTEDDHRILRRYTEDAGKRYCRGIAGCTGCKGTCPRGVNMSDLNRCVTYAYGYGSIELARENYRSLPRSSRIEQCDGCKECVMECVNGLDLNQTIRRARELFT